MIMYLRAHPCSRDAYEKIESHRHGLLIRYDLEMTSYEENYGIAAATVLDKNVCCFTEDKALDLNNCEKHIRNQIAQSGIQIIQLRFSRTSMLFVTDLISLSRSEVQRTSIL